MSGFEFTPFGIVPLGTNVGPLDGMAGATANVEDRSAEYPVMPVLRRAQTPLAAPLARLKPVDVVKLARERLREVERDIRRLKKLETERDELKRLLDAAAHKPRASIRSLPTRSA